jgi:OOP family OmpA-OmpF porin
VAKSDERGDGSVPARLNRLKFEVKKMTLRRLLAVSTFASTVTVGVTSATPAHAQQVEGYASNNFEPSERGSDWFANESLDLRGTFRPAIGIVADYGYRGLIGKVNPDGTVNASVVRDQLFFHPGVSFSIADRLRIGISMPVAAYGFGHQADYPPLSYMPPARDTAIGDLRVSIDLRMFGEYGDAMTAAIGVSGFAPTGDRDAFTGDGVARVQPHLLVAGDLGPFAYAMRAGYEYRDLRADYIDTRLGSTFNFGGAAGFRFADKKILIGPEVFGRTIVGNSHALEEHATPIEIILGGHFHVSDEVRVNAGGGTFITHGYGAPVYRALLGVEWMPGPEKPDRDKDGIPDDEDACPDQAGVRTSDPKTNGCPPPPPDRDGDGIIDAQDACPDVAGIKTDDPKTNGCPPPADRDGDGIPDNEDACPDVAGIKTDDPKTNGCPGDRDKDTVLDNEDACPDVPGVRTADPKTNGCPDPDRDKDGIANDDDACPDEPGPKSEDAKTSGCPRVFIKNGLIQILEQPKFDFNKSVIKKESDSLLTEVAKVMTDHAAIKLVRVEGHTDNVGNAAFNKKLGGARAQAVVTWLIGHGIAKERLKAEGIGKDRPIASNDNEAGRALNRRVEFHIETQDETVKEVVKTPTGKEVTAPPATGTVPADATPTQQKDIPSCAPKYVAPTKPSQPAPAPSTAPKP